MLGNYIDILKTVRRLAESRYREEVMHSKEDNPEGNEIIDISDVKHHEDTSGLYTYLSEQDMQSIKVIQTAMFIGRESEEENYERTLWNSENPEQIRPAPCLKSENPQVLFDKWLADNSGISGRDSKQEEIDYVYEKSPLHEYLERAFYILGIESN